MSFTYDTRELTHGNKYGFFAKISMGTSGKVTFGKAYPFTGLRETSFETSQESNAYYADDVEHVRLQGAKKTEGTIKTYQFSKQFLTDHLGKKLTTSTPPALVDTGSNANFLFCYAENVTDEFGTEFTEFHIWTNVKAGAPKSSTKTDEESVEGKEFEVPVTASPNNYVKDSDGKAVTEIVWRDDKNGTVFEEIKKLFEESPATTIEALLAKALGTEQSSS
ncbi:TPA: phage tail protein [Streptococcus suis]